MSTKKIVALVIVLSVGACSAAGTCMAGMKFKATLTNLKCASATPSTSTCGNCCEADTTKCRGATVACGNAKYKDATKNGMASGSGAAAITACCTDMATCAVAVCSAGMKRKASVNATKCPTDAASCPSSCCEANTAKCRGATVTCGAGKYKDATKNGMDSGTGAAMITNCCTDVATCANAVCGKGMKLKTSESSKKCTGAAASCPSSCCEYDTTKCGGRATKFTCDGTDIAKDHNTAGTTKAQCCMTKPAAATMATCEAFKTSPVASAAQRMAVSVLFAVIGVVALWK